MKSYTFKMEYFLSPLPVSAVVSEVQYRVIGYTIVKYRISPTMAIATNPLSYGFFVNVFRQLMTKGPRTMVSQMTRI